MFNIRRHKNDWLFSICIVLVFASVYGYVIYAQRERLREDALIFELRTLRNAVAIFNYTYGRNPKDFEELATSFFKTSKGAKRPFVPESVVRRGFADPFGNKYLYDPVSGWIRTSEGRYYEW